MAPNITAGRKTKVSKKYAYTEHSKYKEWEKQRRDRFNEKLEELAACLPGHTEHTTWKKVGIHPAAALHFMSMH